MAHVFNIKIEELKALRDGGLYILLELDKKTRLLIDGRGGHWPVRSMKEIKKN